MTSLGRIHSILWACAVVIGAGLCFALTLQVKAVTSDIADADRAILSMRQEIAVLETEFQTRARQQQLVRWNEVEFGYVAPRAGQFFETRQELAALGKPVMIEQSSAVLLADAGDLPEMVPAEAVVATKPVPRSDGVQDDAAAATAREPSVRLAQAEPTKPVVMRQLVARNESSAYRPSVDIAATPAIAAGPDKVRAGAENFARRFDLNKVIAEAEGSR